MASEVIRINIYKKWTYRMDRQNSGRYQGKGTGPPNNC